MRLLFDQNISFRILQQLPEYFAESRQVRHVGLLDKPDIDIWEYARCHDFTIVTFDSDFYDICIIKGIPPKIIWLRTGNLTTKETAEVLISRTTEISLFILNDEQYCMEID
jgi:predicted nuclease of predicted toxin-antitoxin system